MLLRFFGTSVIKYYIIVHSFPIISLLFVTFLAQIKCLRFYGEFRGQKFFFLLLLLSINSFTFAQTPYMVNFRPAGFHYAVSATPFISRVIQNGLISSEIHTMKPFPLSSLYVSRVSNQLIQLLSIKRYSSKPAIGVLYRSADNSLARPDWKNSWMVAIFRPKRRSLLSRRPGWTDNLLNFFFFLSGLQKLEFDRCRLFPSCSS